MKKLFILLTVLVSASSVALAQGTPSSKATADINTAVGCTVLGYSNVGDTIPMNCHDIFSGAPVEVTPSGFAEIMHTTVKVSNSQSLFVSPSLVTGLYTETKTKTSTGGTSTAVAMGGVYLRAVLKDPATGDVVMVGAPVNLCSTFDTPPLGCQQVGSDYGVILDSRVQTLTQSLSDCVVKVGGVTVPGTTCSFDSTIDLILQTTSAHTFNFVFPNVGVGVYHLSIQAAVDASGTLPFTTTGGSGTAIGAAAFGLGSVTVESVRLVHDFAF